MPSALNVVKRLTNQTPLTIRYGAVSSMWLWICRGLSAKRLKELWM